MPKTGGSSLKNQISSLFNNDEVYFDYDGDPANPNSNIQLNPFHYERQNIEPNGYKFIYGHFPSCKYRNVKDAFRMTFLREPIDNIISIYNFWMLHQIEKWENALFQYVVKNKLTIVEFSRLPTFRNLYSKVYFQEQDIESFDFVGDFKFYDAELDRLSGLLGVKFDKSVRDNVTGNLKSESGHELIVKDELTVEDIRLINDALIDDKSFYERYVGK